MLSPRAASISAARALIGRPRRTASARNADQKLGSSDTLVRWPRSVSECLTGRESLLDIVELLRVEPAAHLFLVGRLFQSLGLGPAEPDCVGIRQGLFLCPLAILPGLSEIADPGH